MKNILEKLIETNLEIIKLLNNISDVDDFTEDTETKKNITGRKLELFKIFNKRPSVPTKQLAKEFDVSERMIQRYRKEWRETPKEDKHSSNQSNQYTYLIKNKRNNLYKIGRSKNPKLREKTLQSEEPNIIIVKTWHKDIERILHQDYKDFRVRGEWFKLNKTQVKYICTQY